MTRNQNKQPTQSLYPLLFLHSKKISKLLSDYGSHQGSVLHITWIADAIDRRVIAGKTLPEVMEGEDILGEAEGDPGCFRPLGDGGAGGERC